VQAGQELQQLHGLGVAWYGDYEHEMCAPGAAEDEVTS